MGVKAIYPASFDPVTLGHVDIARRAAAIFDEVIVAVYDTPAKTLLFTTEERLNLLRAAMRGIEHVRVEKYHGLTTDFARARGPFPLTHSSARNRPGTVRPSRPRPPTFNKCRRVRRISLKPRQAKDC